jgi:hypothetical protein
MEIPELSDGQFPPFLLYGNNKPKRKYDHDIGKCTKQSMQNIPSVDRILC